MKSRDQNGIVVYKHLKKEGGGWGVNVFAGPRPGLVTTIQRYIYATRAQARDADISDTIGVRGKFGNSEPIRTDPE